MLVSTHTRRNAKRIKNQLKAWRVPDDYFEVHTRHEQLMLDQNVTLARSSEGVKFLIKSFKRGEAIDVLDPDSRKYALAYRAFCSSSFLLQIWEEVQNENSTVSWNLDLVMRHYMAADLPFGGQALIVTTAVTQIAAMPISIEATGLPMGNVHVATDLFFDCDGAYICAAHEHGAWGP